MWIAEKYQVKIVQECNRGVANKGWQRPNSSLMNQSLNQWVPAITALPQILRDPKESCSSVNLGKRGGTFPVGIVSWRRPVLVAYGEVWNSGDVTCGTRDPCHHLKDVDNHEIHEWL